MAAGTPAAAPDAWETSVFVAPRDPTADAAAVTAKLSSVGTVVGVSAATVAGTSFIVQFATAEEAAAAAAQLDDTPLAAGGAKGMRVLPARKPLPREVVPAAIFVRNLAREATEEEILAVFAGVGEVAKFRLIARRGAAEIVFTEDAAVEGALTKNGGSLHGRVFYVERQEKAKGLPPRERKPRGGGGGGGAAGGGEGAVTSREVAADPRKVRLGGLAEGTTQADVEGFVGPMGAFKKVKVVDSTVSGLHAYVTFEEAEGAAAAVGELNGADLNGAPVVVEADKPRVRTRRKGGRGRAAAEGGAAEPAGPPAEPDPLRVWVGNLPADIEASDVTDKFTGFGEVARFQRRNKGSRFCYITFATPAGATAALAGKVFIGEEELNIQASTTPAPRKRVRSDRVRNVRPNRREVADAGAAQE